MIIPKNILYLDFLNALTDKEAGLRLSANANFQHGFGAYPASYTAQLCMNGFAEGKLSLLDEAAGADKLHFWKAVIGNALANGLGCWVCSEDTELLQKLQALIPSFGSAQPPNPQPLTPSFGSAQPPNPQPLTQKSVPFPRNTARILQNTANFIQQWAQLASGIQQHRIGTSSYPETVAILLQNAHNRAASGKFTNPLQSKLDPKGFDFSPEETESIRVCLLEGEPLFRKLGSLQHPFNVFEDRFFKNPNQHQVEAELNDTLDKVLFVVDAAMRDMLAYLYEYEQALENHFTEFFAQINELLDKLRPLLVEAKGYHKYFQPKKSRITNMLGEWTGKNQRFELLQNQIEELYEQICDQHSQYLYIPYVFPNLETQNLSFDQFLETLQAFESALMDWYREREELIRSYLNAFSVDNVHPYTKFGEKVKTITAQLDNFEQKFAQTRLLKIGFKFVGANLPARIKQLEQLQTNTQSLKSNWSDFQDYYPLKYFWLGLSPKQQQVFQTLAFANLPENSWAETWSDWAYAQGIAKQEPLFWAALPARMEDIRKYLWKDWEAAQTALAEFIRLCWAQKPAKYPALPALMFATPAQYKQLLEQISTDTPEILENAGMDMLIWDNPPAEIVTNLQTQTADWSELPIMEANRTLYGELVAYIQKMLAIQYPDWTFQTFELSPQGIEIPLLIKTPSFGSVVSEQRRTAQPPNPQPPASAPWSVSNAELLSYLIPNPQSPIPNPQSPTPNPQPTHAIFIDMVQSSPAGYAYLLESETFAWLASQGIRPILTYAYRWRTAPEQELAKIISSLRG